MDKPTDVYIPVSVTPKNRRTNHDFLEFIPGKYLRQCGMILVWLSSEKSQLRQTVPLNQAER